MIASLKMLPAAAKYAEQLTLSLVPAAQPLIGRETIVLALIREVQDYTILRTEETRELNTVWTPRGVSDAAPIERVAFLATKQKAAESRELESLLRTWASPHDIPRKGWECYLKSQLCLECPRCILFGATDVSKGTDKGANIKHRIAYGTAFSLEPVDPNLREVHTFNGVSGATQLTGQTLGDRESVRPGSLFASVVTLRSVTEIEFILALKAILACTRYGAETRIGGIVRNHVVGLAAAHEEILSPLELTLELGRKPEELPATANSPEALPDRVPHQRVFEVLETYGKKASMPKQVHVLSAESLRGLLKDVQEAELSKELIKEAFEAAQSFRKQQAGYLKKEKPKKGD